MESTESSYVSSPEGPRKHASSPPPESPSQGIYLIRSDLFSLDAFLCYLSSPHCNVARLLNVGGAISRSTFSFPTLIICNVTSYIRFDFFYSMSYNVIVLCFHVWMRFFVYQIFNLVYSVLVVE